MYNVVFRQSVPLIYLFLHCLSSFDFEKEKFETRITMRAKESLVHVLEFSFLFTICLYSHWLAPQLSKSNAHGSMCVCQKKSSSRSPFILLICIANTSLPLLMLFQRRHSRFRMLKLAIQLAKHFTRLSIGVTTSLACSRSVCSHSLSLSLSRFYSMSSLIFLRLCGNWQLESRDCNCHTS